MVHQLFTQAIAAHTAGDTMRAEGLYRQVLALAPDHADAWHLLGRLALEAGDPKAALEPLATSIRLKPRIAEFQVTFGEAQRALGDAAQAAETLRRAVRLKPESAQIQLSHGIALSAAGQGALAVQAIRRAIARDPSLVAAHRTLGAQMMAERQYAAAAEAFRAAAGLAPHDAEALFNLGCALQHMGDLAGAEQHFRAAVALRPDYLHAANNLGVLLQSAGRLAEAAEWLTRATALDPRTARSFLNLGLVLRDMSRFAEAEAAFRAAERLEPTAETLCCIGNALRDQAAQDPAALAASAVALNEALARDPAHRESHIALAFTHLLAGDLAAGWPHFAWRDAAAIGRARVGALTKAPAWRGEKLAGTLLIHAEQGAGDFLQMCRFVAQAAALATRVVLLVPPPLQRIARSLAGAAEVLKTGDTLPPVDAVCADMDLPGIFAASLASIPRGVPYLAADPAEIAVWRARLAALPGCKVGLAWAGNPAYAADRQRSVPSSELSGLAGLENVTLISLQPGAAAPDGLDVLDFSSELTDFAATASLIEALDLTIAVDSAVAHLAGTLGRPVWLLNRFAPDWRWLLGRVECPWYPSLRQFRQASPGDWAGGHREVGRAATPIFAGGFGGGGSPHPILTSLPASPQSDSSSYP